MAAKWCTLRNETAECSQVHPSGEGSSLAEPRRLVSDTLHMYSAERWLLLLVPECTGSWLGPRVVTGESGSVGINKRLSLLSLLVQGASTNKETHRPSHPLDAGFQEPRTPRDRLSPLIFKKHPQIPPSMSNFPRIATTMATIYSLPRRPGLTGPHRPKACFGEA